VSHDMTAIERLCKRCVYLESGKIVADGKPESIIPLFLNKEKEAA
jgi:ABC-type polysaccharide/polyol phosphate transport system ATPase subunit